MCGWGTWAQRGELRVWVNFVRVGNVDTERGAGALFGSFLAYIDFIRTYMAYIAYIA